MTLDDPLLRQVIDQAVGSIELARGSLSSKSETAEPVSCRTSAGAGTISDGSAGSEGAEPSSIGTNSGLLIGEDSVKGRSEMPRRKRSFTVKTIILAGVGGWELIDDFSCRLDEDKT